MQGISPFYPSQNVLGYALYCIQINYIAKMHYGYLDSCCITTYLHSFMRHRAKSSKYIHCCIKCPQNLQVKTLLQMYTAFTCRIYNEILL